MTHLHVTDHAVERFRQRIGSVRPADEIREALALILRDAAEIGATRYTVNGVTFCFKRKGENCAVTTAYTSETRPPMRKVPRSDLTRREEHRLHRKMVKRMNR